MAEGGLNDFISRTLVAKLIGEIDRSFECVSMSDECISRTFLLLPDSAKKDGGSREQRKRSSAIKITPLTHLSRPTASNDGQPDDDDCKLGSEEGWVEG